MGYKNKQDLYRNQIQRWTKRKKAAIEHKGGKCERCGYSKYYGALHFHHRDPLQKDASWIKIRLWPWKRIISEIDKCDLLCANCHAEEHAKSL